MTTVLLFFRLLSVKSVPHCGCCAFITPAPRASWKPPYYIQHELVVQNVTVRDKRRKRARRRDAFACSIMWTDPALPPARRPAPPPPSPRAAPRRPTLLPPPPLRARPPATAPAPTCGTAAGSARRQVEPKAQLEGRTAKKGRRDQRKEPWLRLGECTSACLAYVPPGPLPPCSTHRPPASPHTAHTAGPAHRGGRAHRGGCEGHQAGRAL